jgi:hypothetical protein
MNKNLIYVSDAGMADLTLTAAVGGFALEDLVGTAVWAFARHEEAHRAGCVRDFLFFGNAARPAAPVAARRPRRRSRVWHAVHIPPSSKALLRKNAREDFSPIQKIMAAVHSYCSLPVGDRIQLAREYVGQTQVKNAEHHSSWDEAIM